jgi:hypothetical protein
LLQNEKSEGVYPRSFLAILGFWEECMMHQRGMYHGFLVQQLSTTFRILQGFSAFVKTYSVNR